MGKLEFEFRRGLKLGDLGTRIGRWLMGFSVFWLATHFLKLVLSRRFLPDKKVFHGASEICVFLPFADFN